MFLSISILVSNVCELYVGIISARPKTCFAPRRNSEFCIWLVVKKWSGFNLKIMFWYQLSFRTFLQTLTSLELRQLSLAFWLCSANSLVGDKNNAWFSFESFELPEIEKVKKKKTNLGRCVFILENIRSRLPCILGGKNRGNCHIEKEKTPWDETGQPLESWIYQGTNPMQLVWMNERNPNFFKDLKKMGYRGIVWDWTTFTCKMCISVQWKFL